MLAVLGLHGRVDRLRLGTWSDGAFSASTFHDLVFGYDPRGRLRTVTQGSGDSARTVTYRYDENGFVDQVTDPASQTHQFDYDDAGRPTTVTLPGGQIIGLAYDADGNLSGVTPPGQPQHTLEHNEVDDLERYTPPDVLPGEDATQYIYDDDHALTDIVRPDGRTLSFGYDDDTGQLDAVLTDSRNIELRLLARDRAVPLLHRGQWRNHGVQMGRPAAQGCAAHGHLCGGGDLELWRRLPPRVGDRRRRLHGQP